jgi:hypothetical protein
VLGRVEIDQLARADPLDLSERRHLLAAPMPMDLVPDVGMPEAGDDVRVARHDPEPLAGRRVDLRDRGARPRTRA